MAGKLGTVGFFCISQFQIVLHPQYVLIPQGSLSSYQLVLSP